ncbi:MAG: tetratricopeptide repeat protein [Candidatus Krumholzibacteria bacterium]|nr:tetratricopeptide repeat protein [Candidatus Krumholzibacteria bacterium]
MNSFELREEINHGGSKYFLQTSFMPKKGCIQSSFFKNGALFDTVVKEVDEKSSTQDIRSLTKEVHIRNKGKLQFLLDVRDNVNKSIDYIPHLRLAQALFRRNLFAEAIKESQLAIEKGDNDSQPYIVIGESFYRMGDYEKAFEAIGKGIDVNPEYPDLHNLLGQIYLKQKMCREAIESFKRAIGLNLYYGESYFNLSKAYLLNTIIKEDYELSRDMDSMFSANLERASQLNPFIQGEVLEQAKGLFREGKYEETLELLDEITEKARRGGIRDIMLELYLMLIHSGDDLDEGDIEVYLERVKEIIEQNPTFADGYNSLGILYTAKCKILMDKASKAFSRALEINSNYRKAQKNLRLAENDRQGIFILLKALLD